MEMEEHQSGIVQPLFIFKQKAVGNLCLEEVSVAAILKVPRKLLNSKKLYNSFFISLITASTTDLKNSVIFVNLTSSTDLSKQK